MFFRIINNKYSLHHPTLANLALAWGNGERVRFNKGKESYTGLIVGIKVESGYVDGQKPVHFLVTLDTGDEVYVRTQSGGA